MSTLAVEVNPLARNVSVSSDELSVDLADGRRIIVPLVWFPRLLAASSAARARWELLGDGEGIHWPDVNEGSHNPGADQERLSALPTVLGE